MDTADRLIEYYFQRRVAGMSISDIEESLHKQMMDEEERELILSQVEHKRDLYLKALKGKKLARIFLTVSISTLAVSLIVLVATILKKDLPYGTPIIVSLLILSFAFGLTSVLFLQRSNKPVFTL